MTLKKSQSSGPEAVQSLDDEWIRAPLFRAPSLRLLLLEGLR